MLNAIMRFCFVLVGKNLTSTFLMLPYFAWWGFIYNFFTSGASSYPNSCGAANGGAIMLTIFLFVSYVTVLLIRAALVKHKRADYYVFLGLVCLPMLFCLILGLIGG